MQLQQAALSISATLLPGTEFSTTLAYTTVSGRKLGGGHSELPLGLEIVSAQPINVYACRADNRYVGAFFVPPLTNTSTEFFVAGWMLVSSVDLLR